MSELRYVATLEADLIADDCVELDVARANLAHRHGDRFRAFERKIEAFAERANPADIVVTSIGDGRHVVTWPPLHDLIKEARELGLLVP